MFAGIIGTAGRKEDSKKINRNLYFECCKIVLGLIEKYNVKACVSGGAAFADHIAISLFNHKKIEKLFLHLPVEFDIKYKETQDKYCPGRIANWYHKNFSKKCGIDSLQEIKLAIKNGAEMLVTPGFKERNTKVAFDSSILIALTFGAEAYIKNGGTQDTCKKFLDLGKENLIHINLNDLKIYEPGKIN